jgi:hypothetical protein
VGAAARAKMNTGDADGIEAKLTAALDKVS